MLGPGEKRKLKTEIVNNAFERLPNNELKVCDGSQVVFQEVLSMTKQRWAERQVAGHIKAVDITKCGGKEGPFSLRACALQEHTKTQPCKSFKFGTWCYVISVVMEH